MSDSIFRKKSMDKITSPEQLTDYIRVTNPSVWMVLGAVIVLLIGVCVWGIFGKLDTKLKVAAQSKDGQVVCYVKESDIQSVKEDMAVVIDEKEAHIRSVSVNPIAVGDDFSEYAMHISDLEKGEWVFVVETDSSLPDGIYEAEIIIDRVSPASFVLN